MIPSLHNSGLRRRQNTLTEFDEESELEESNNNDNNNRTPLLLSSSTHRNQQLVATLSSGSTRKDREYVEPLLTPTASDYNNNHNSNKAWNSPGTTCSTISSSSSTTCVEYCSRFHPTLLRHYYDLQSFQLHSTFTMADINDNNNNNNAVMNDKQQQQLPLPQLAYTEIVMGEIIGRGGFSFVHEIKDVRLQDVYDTSEDESRSRAVFAASFRQSSSSPLEITGSSTSSTSTATTAKKTTKQSSPYVLKTLRPDLPEDEHNKGIIDLAVEAQFLSSLKHPHILSLRASSNSDPLESKYFVILDRLISTLDYKLKVWRRDVGMNMGYWCGGCVGYCCARVHVLHRIWMERFTVARDVASALEYLHGQNIVYRDLKPDNIGFNAEGQLKMFDFGLAKRITNADKAEDDLYNLTGNTGSLRYMAPEVALNRPYSLSVDAYSFGILFWQLCALTTPYSGYSCKMHSDLVVGRGYRPSPDNSWPETWSTLMRECWSADARSRPAFPQILKAITEELEELTAEGDSFVVEENGQGNKETEKIRARKPRSFKIRARRDSQRLDVDTRLSVQPVKKSQTSKVTTERKHDAPIV